jgi:hypothetical protein
MGALTIILIAAAVVLAVAFVLWGPDIRSRPRRDGHGGPGGTSLPGPLGGGGDGGAGGVG